MTGEPDRHRRRSLRLQGYDYAQAGAYFVTICTQNRACLFGQVTDDEMRLNEAGHCLHEQWMTLRERFSGVTLDSFVIMPNHFHGIVCIQAVGAQFIAPQFIAPQFIAPQTPENPHAIPGAMNRAPTLGEIIRTFKAVSTRHIRQMGISEFAWQRNYYEHIIRDEAALQNIREYIANNPLQWALDRENPTNVMPGAMNRAPTSWEEV